MPTKDVEKGKPERCRRSSKKGSISSDSLGSLFSMYLKTAETEENTMAERWQKDADGILIFTGLFSAIVALFLTFSIPDLNPNSQDTSAFYLKNIYQHLADPNVSVPSTAAAPPTFSPPRNAVIVNLLWVFSLGIGLACAIMATMLQQWARRYIAITQFPRGSPRDRARTRAMFADSVDKLVIKTMGIFMACSLHLSIVLFSIGLLVFFHNLNRIIFFNILCFFTFCVTIYIYFTVLPLFQSCSLLYTPVSVLPAAFVVLSTYLIHADRFKFKRWNFFEWLFESVGDVEHLSSKPTPELDARILELTLNTLGEDDAMEKSFAAIPDLFEEKVDLPADLSEKLQEAFKGALYRFLDYTFRSTTVAESVKNSRLIICLNASSAVLDPNGLREILQEILDGRWPELLQSVEMGHSLRSWVDRSDEENFLYIQKIISLINENAEMGDDRLVGLAADQPGMSENLLQYYLADNNFLDRPSSYPLCNTGGHRLDSTTHVYNEDVFPANHSRIQSVPLHNPVLVSGPGTQPFNMSIPHSYTPANEKSLLARLEGQPVPTGNSSPDLAAVQARQGNTNISAPKFDPHPIFSREVASQQSESVFPRSTVNDAKVLPSFTDSAMTQSHSSYAQGFASLSPPAAAPHISPQVMSDLEPHIITRISTLHAPDDTLDQNILIPMEISRHPSKSASSTPNIAGNILRPGDSQQDMNQS